MIIACATQLWLINVTTGLSIKEANLLIIIIIIIISQGGHYE
jgi:hypothetical protein